MRWPPPSGPPTTRTSWASRPGCSPELIEAAVRSGRPERAAGAARAARGDQPRPAGRTGRSASRPAPRAAERGRGRRAPLPRGDRAARPHPRPGGARPRPPALRRVAAPRGPARRRPRAAADRPRMFTGWAWRGSPSAPAASCWPPARRCASAPSRRATSSPPRRRRSPGWPPTADEPGDRRPAVPQRPHRRVAPAQGVHEARHQLPPGAARGTARPTTTVPADIAAPPGYARRPRDRPVLSTGATDR